MPTLTPTGSQTGPAAMAEDFCLISHLNPRDFWAGLKGGEALVWMVALSLALRLCLAAFMPFTADEAYAVVVSRSHSLSYFDHPPMMFVLARFMADLTGSESALLLRLPFVVMGTASLVFIYDITRRCFGARAGFWAAAAFSVSPFFLSFGQLLIVPDGPLDLFLLVSFWAMLPILLEGEAKLFNWVLAGLALALALMSKYQAVLFGVGALLAMVSSVEGRRLLLQPGCWLAFGLASLGLLPILAWNASHEWISFAFQTGRAYQATGFGTHAVNFVSVLLGQAIYVLPGVWYIGQKAIWRGLSKPRVPIYRWLAILAVVPIVTFDIIGLFGHHTLPHWAMSGFLFALPLVGDVRARVEVSRRKYLNRVLLGASLIIPAIALLICLQSQTGILTRFTYSEAPSFDIGWQNLEWTPKSGTLPRPDSFLVTEDWVQAGHAGLAFGPEHPIEILTEPHQFQFMDQARLKQLSQGYYVTAVPMSVQVRDLTKIEAPLKGRFVPNGEPLVQTQFRMGFPSFHLVTIPVRRALP